MPFQKNDYLKVSLGQQLSLPEYDQPLVKITNLKYLVFSSQRTGSNYICRRLCNIENRLGLPNEYLNPEAIRLLHPRLIGKEMTLNSFDLNEYMTAIEEVRTTSDGVFGIKVQPAQLNFLIKGDNNKFFKFINSFDRIIFQLRRDMLDQAISATISNVTNSWFDIGQEKKIPANFDEHKLFAQTAKYLSTYTYEKVLISTIAKSISKPSILIHYEEILADASGTFSAVLGFLNNGSNIALQDLKEKNEFAVPEKSQSEFADQFRRKFLAFIAGKPEQLTD